MKEDEEIKKAVKTYFNIEIESVEDVIDLLDIVKNGTVYLPYKRILDSVIKYLKINNNEQ